MVEANIRQIYQIKGNQPLLLKQLKSAWKIRSGAIAIFAVTVEDGKPKGNRYHLFDLTAGSALFGVGTIEDLEENCPRSLLAVALSETELERLDLMSKSPQLLADIANWVEHLSQWLQTKSTTVHGNGVYAAAGSHYLSLLEHQVLLPETETVWVRLQQGCVRWMGNPAFKLNSVSPVFPLTKGMWLEAEAEVELYTSSIEELAADEAVDSLIRLHQYYFQYFSIINRQATEREYERFQARNQLNSQKKGTAIASLAAVLEPKTAEPLLEGTPLLVAVGAVGRAMGIKVLPPAKSEDLTRIKNPLDAIARASGFPTRQVILSGNWWQQDSGALLGYILETGDPVALLPNNQRYFLFDPIQKTKVEIDSAIAETISPEAYTFYRPLPKLISKPLEVLKFAIRGYQWDALLIIILGIVVSLLGMVTPQATAILINSAIPDGDRLLLWQMGLGLIAVAFGTTGFELAKGIVTLRIENVADSNLQLAVWDRMLKLSPAFFRRYSTGDLIGRVMSVTQIRSELSGATQRTLLSGVFALLNLALMLFYSWKLALVAVGITIAMVSMTTASSAIIIRKSRRLEKLTGDIEGLTVQLINGVAKLRVAAAEGRAFATWANQYSRTTKLNSQIRQINDTVSVISTMLSLISSVLLFWFAVWFINSALDKGLPGLSLGAFLAFNSAYGTFFSGVSDLSNVGTDILGIVPLWERAQPILESTIESDSDKADPGRLTGQIATDRLTFRYREDGPLILEDISLKIEPGEFVAFVGASGSGKSTLFRLLLGFETPISGTVYYDNQDLAGLNIQAVRRQFGVVLQSGRIGAGSVFDNITSGALATLDEAWTASRMAGFAEDIEQMPMGMHTIVSEGGSNLSGGQRQRLLIARALISRPKILLMDEATSALDNKTQAIVSQSIDRLDTTRIVIAHRLSTIRNADRIYVLEGGRIVQAGNFEQLMRQDGLFARLVARQLE